MLRKYLTWARVVANAWLLLALTGCVPATTRYIANPTAPPPDTGRRASSDEIELTLHYVIVPDGPGSWMKRAKWNEFVISMRNSTERDVTMERISLIDSRGVYLNSEYPSPFQFETASEALAKEYSVGGGQMAIGVAGQLAGAFSPVWIPGLTGILMTGTTIQRKRHRPRTARR